MSLKVTEFDAAGALTGDEIFGLVQDAGNVQSPLSDIAEFVIASAIDAEWALNWTDDADVYIPAIEAMTIDQGNAAIGTGTLAYEKSTTVAPGTFAGTSLPATLQAGAWLKVSATSVSGFKATHLKRTA